MRTIYLTLLLGCLALPAVAAPPTATLISAKKIWDKRPHNAFTDLVYWKDQFVCAFRVGRRHVSTDGRIQVLTSPDGETWTPAAVVSMEGYDCRDACLSTTPDGRLMLNGGAAPRKVDNDLSPTGTFVAFSDDAKTWTKPQIVVEPGRWLWHITWHEGKAYGISYSSIRPLRTDVSTQLLQSSDGVKFTPLVPELFGDGVPTEAKLQFGDDGTMYCLQRRDKEPRPTTAYFGKSRPPYTEWEWHDLNTHVSGPNLIHLPSGQWIADGRMFDGKDPKMKLAVLDVDKNTIEPILTLPSGGDCSYPGLVWRDGVLWISYYSSHEGKASIYFAKVKIE